MALAGRVTANERASYIRSAALSPNVAAKLFDESPENPPSPENLKHKLVFQFGFNDESAKSATEIFFKNLEFAKLYDSANIVVDPDSEAESLETDPVNPSMKRSISTSQIPPAASVTGKVERIIGPNGPIAIQFGEDPTWESYDFLENYIKLRKSVLKKGE